MSARFLSVPAVDWLAPIDHSAMARPARPKACAARSISPAATPQTEAARAGGHARATSSARSQPLVWRATNGSSTRPSRSSTWSIALSSARSVPGRTGRCRSLARAVAVGRGSAQITNAPSAWRSRTRLHTIGWHAAVLVPSSSRQSASPRSS